MEKPLFTHKTLPQSLVAGGNPFYARGRNAGVLALAVALGVFTGCARTSPDTEERPSPQLQGVAATWSGGQLTLGEFLHAFRELQNPDAVDTTRVAEIVSQLFHEWVAEKILAERAQEAGMHQDPRALDELAALREDRSIAFFVRKQIDEAIRIKRRDIQQFYDEHQERFLSPGTYTYFRIFFSNQVHGVERAKQRAEECWRMLENGANFHDLVPEFSDTREEKRDTEYGPFKAGENSPVIEQVILETPVRRFSKVVELPDGFMIFYPETKTESVPRSLSAVEKEISRELFTEQQKAKVEGLMRDLAARYQGVTHKELFDAAEVKSGEVLLEIRPEGARFTWGEFEEFAESQSASNRSEKEAALELFTRRKLLLHHIKKNKFETTDYFRRRFRPLESRVLSDYYLRATVDPEADPTEEEMLKYYDENPDEFRRPEKIEAWHIAKKIPYPVDASEKDRATAESRVYGTLLEVRRRVGELGESFKTWADRFTDYGDHGYLGFQPVLALPPEWISVVATLEEGEVSRPIRVKDTFELVMRGKKEEGGVLKFEVAKQQVRERAKESKVRNLRTGHVEKVLAEVGTQYDIHAAAQMVVKLLDRATRPPEYWLDPYQ